MLLTALATAPAGASPVDDKKAEAARLARQLDEQGQRISVLDERFNQARLALDRVNAALATTRAGLAASNHKVATARAHLAQAAVNAYMHGGANAMIGRLTRSRGDDLVVRRQYLRVAAADDSQALDEMRAARQDQEAVQSQLESQQRAAQAATDRAAAARRAGSAAEAAEQALLDKTKGELATLVAAETARRAAESERAAKAALDRAAKGAGSAAKGAGSAAKKAGDLVGSAAKPLGLPPPVSKGAAAAVAAAEAQVGKPYVYGGSGPNVFDCSGLMMFAWRAGGVSLSHSATAQYSETTRVPISAIQPGDILFFGSPIHHDAMYVGNGQMVEAPHTGLDVRYASINRSDLVGAGRPG